MNNNTLPLHIRRFNDRIKTMNQTHGSSLSMTAAEARALHTEIFALLADYIEQQESKNRMVDVIRLDPGDNSL